MILIGSSGQNTGKTTLVKAFIKVWKGRFPIAVLKITSIAEAGVLCCRGGCGCGACGNLGNLPFILAEERGEAPEKDTGALLDAGADHVFWLRSLYSALAEGYSAFLEKIPKDALIFCESNSLREVVHPGCFIMLINSAHPAMKPTAARVLALADMVVQNTRRPEDLERIVLRIQVKHDPAGDLRVSLGC
jgi:hypothetical protein